MNYILKLVGLFISSLFLFGCFNPEDYDTPAASADKISFISTDVANVPADGVNTGLVKVRISDEASPGRRTVIFKASSGFFVGGKGDSIAVTATENFTAAAELANVNATTAVVTAKILGVEAPGNSKVIFVKAYPKTISVAVDSFSVAKNYDYKSEITITANLRTENGGKPSVGHGVSFSVTQPNTTPPASVTPIGDFLNDRSTATTDADGKARIRFTPGTSARAGYATITASTVVSEAISTTVSGVVSTTPASTSIASTRIYIR